MISVPETIKAFCKSAQAKYMKGNLGVLKELEKAPCCEMPDVSTLDAKECIALDIRATIKSYARCKDNAIRIFQEYIGFLKSNYGCNIDIDFPPIPVSISLERQMYILKLLQDRPEMSVEDVSELLLISERTVEADFAKLKGLDDDPLQVMGQRLVVEFDRTNGEIKFPSTVHPLFLTNNLTQIISLLEGLKVQEVKPGFENYARNSAKTMWAQLSDYARNRIIEICCPLLSLDAAWYKELDLEVSQIVDKDLFLSERQCSRIEGAGCVLDCLKNQKSCVVEYLSEDEKVDLYQVSKVTDYNTGSVWVDVDGRIIELELDKILRSAYSIEELL